MPCKRGRERERELWRYYALAIVGTSRYLQWPKCSISTKTQVEPTIGQLFQCRLSLGPKGFARDM